MSAAKKVKLSTVCVCPLKTHPDLSEYKIGLPNTNLDKLREEVEATDYQLNEKKHQLIVMRRQLTAMKRILHLELGYEARPHIQLLATPEWKKRAQEENNLKSNLVHLVDYLRDQDSCFKRDPSCHPAKLSASMQRLMTEKQRDKLRHLYHGKTVFHSGNEENVGTCLRNYLDLKEDYQNKLFHNRALVDETNRMKTLIENAHKRDDGYLDLIHWVSGHQYPQTGFKALVEKMDKEGKQKGIAELKLDGPAEEQNAELEKYKASWEANVKEKQKMENRINELNTRMDKTNRIVCSSEEMCASSLARLQTLCSLLKQEILLSKAKPPPNIARDGRKFNMYDFLSTTNALRLARDENQCLRKFIISRITSKEDDFKKLKSSLTSTAETYSKILDDVRSVQMKKEQK